MSSIEGLVVVTVKKTSAFVLFAFLNHPYLQHHRVRLLQNLAWQCRFNSMGFHSSDLLSRVVS
jgi:hypothetical protein